MSKLQEIMNEVSKEQYDCSWAYAFTFMHPEDVEELMQKVALRYAKEVARHNLERAAEAARTRTNDESTSIIVDKETVTSVEIELI